MRVSARRQPRLLVLLLRLLLAILLRRPVAVAPFPLGARTFGKRSLWETKRVSIQRAPMAETRAMRSTPASMHASASSGGAGADTCLGFPSGNGSVDAASNAPRADPGVSPAPSAPMENPKTSSRAAAEARGGASFVHLRAALDAREARRARRPRRRAGAASHSEAAHRRRARIFLRGAPSWEPGDSSASATKACRRVARTQRHVVRRCESLDPDGCVDEGGVGGVGGFGVEVVGHGIARGGEDERGEGAEVRRAARGGGRQRSRARCVHEVHRALERSRLICGGRVSRAASPHRARRAARRGGWREERGGGDRDGDVLAGAPGETSVPMRGPRPSAEAVRASSVRRGRPSRCVPGEGRRGRSVAEGWKSDAHVTRMTATDRARATIRTMTGTIPTGVRPALRRAPRTPSSGSSRPRRTRSDIMEELQKVRARRSRALPLPDGYPISPPVVGVRFALGSPSSTFLATDTRVPVPLASRRLRRRAWSR